MNIEMILPEYRVEMTGAMGLLRDKVVAGEMSPNQFLDGQARIYRAYLAVSVKRMAEKLVGWDEV